MRRKAERAAVVAGRESRRDGGLVRMTERAANRSATQGFSSVPRLVGVRLSPASQLVLPVCGDGGALDLFSEG